MLPPGMTAGSQPNLYVVAGPNGAGKSTFSRLFLPDYADCREFVNADLIAAGLSPFNPEGQALPAGRLMLARIESLARAQIDFGFETTLAGRSWVPLLLDLRRRGKCVIRLAAHELSRARGGPRCMAMPLVREDLT